MNKAILISIKPKWVKEILNGNKTIEIRKKFPKDYVGWVYIYCCAEDKNGYLIRNRSTKKMEYTYNGFVASVCWLANRKVVARFWCDKVEEIKLNLAMRFFTKTLNEKKLKEQACLNTTQFEEYLLNKNENFNCAYAIHITNLEIFDKPKEISEFCGAFTQKRYEHIFGNNAVELDKKYGGLRQPIKSGYEYKYPLTRAPQSWCYVEV